MDNSAATVVDERVLQAMQPFWKDVMGNAGSIHTEGREAKSALEDARKTIARIIHAQNEQIVFTSGGTESNNLAVQGVVRREMEHGKRPEEIHIATSAVEHSSVLDCFKALERTGVRVTYLEADEAGVVTKEVLASAIKKETVLVSLVYANNEIGTIQNASTVAHAIKEAREKNDSPFPLLHYDASQAPVWLSLDMQKMRADFLTLDSQKLYGPKGIGCLFVRNRDSVAPLFYGGSQEFGLRPGTPPLPFIAGFAKAYELVEEERDTYVNNVRGLRDWFIMYILEHIPETTLNGLEGDNRIAGNVSFSFKGIEGEQLVVEMDVHGIAISTGSACLSHETGGSHVIKALNKRDFSPNGTVRFSFSRHTTREEVEHVAKTLVEAVEWLRQGH